MGEERGDGRRGVGGGGGGNVVAALMEGMKLVQGTIRGSEEFCGENRRWGSGGGEGLETEPSNDVSVSSYGRF